MYKKQNFMNVKSNFSASWGIKYTCPYQRPKKPQWTERNISIMLCLGNSTLVTLCTVVKPSPSQTLPHASNVGEIIGRTKETNTTNYGRIGSQAKTNPTWRKREDRKESQTLDIYGIHNKKKYQILFCHIQLYFIDQIKS
jgi:hypothetical protein